MPTKKPRYTLIVEEELLEKIDDYRFQNRLASRSLATVELIKLGLNSLKDNIVRETQSEYDASFSKDEIDIIDKYRELSDKAKRKIKINVDLEYDDVIDEKEQKTRNA
ncbi:hypothetical protein GXM21_06755 [Megamonas funiformis]|uniref:Ribbon-helix-helix protein CopG domain-containing protein n=1 Tax=Megamonas funiformis YIT 11815 TaxID=742816 RepID=A0ABN0EKK4_9FIRM|nr:hypothetical protein [Megamonas funiformis]EHR38768.1 hypothetical protein HMPREF9454_00573 [Megamonas funiformis YIT 11815]QIB58867.1 hypothetical protein GXM21_06755 [Megamonas funiformis]